MSRSTQTRRMITRRALTLVEVIVSIAIVGTLLAASFTAAGVSAKRSLSSAEQTRAAWLAHDLLAEIAAKPCRADDPSKPGGGLTIDLGVIGLTVGASTGNNRSAFDDVFDYHSWNATPPVDADGTAVAGYDGWTRAASVEPIDPFNLAARAGDDSAALITVVAVSPTGQRATVQTIRTAAMDAARGATP